MLEAALSQQYGPSGVAPILKAYPATAYATPWDLFSDVIGDSIMTWSATTTRIPVFGCVRTVGFICLWCLVLCKQP